MNREQKSIEIEKLKEKFSKTPLAVLTDYKGLKVNDFNELRRKLFEKQSRISVVKNRLAKVALKGTSLEFLSQHFTGTTTLLVVEKDPVGPAKVILDFAKNHEQVTIKAAAMDGKALNTSQLTALASLPSREELIAKLLGSMQAPARNLVSVMAQIPRQLVNVLAAVRDQKEKAGS